MFVFNDHSEQYWCSEFRACCSSCAVSAMIIVSKIQNILNLSGFSSKWDENLLNVELFKLEFQQRSNDIFIQTWNDDIGKNSQCSNYVDFKKSHKMEKYLLLLDDSHKFNIAKFRMRVHHLPITNNRFSQDENVDVTCPLCCSGSTGNEYHYLFECNYFSESRTKMLPHHIQNYQVNSSSKWYDIFNSDRETLQKVARFVKIVMNSFKYRKKTPQSPAKRQLVTRSGRNCKPVIKLNL